jgi:hypothetical protein
LHSSSPTSNAHDALRDAIESGIQVEYPTVQPPSSNGSYASSFDPEKPSDLPIFPTPSRMVEPGQREQWTSRLSTIQSETEPRASQSISVESRQNGQRNDHRTTIASIASSALQAPPSLPSDTSVSIPAPLFRNARHHADDSEGDDVVGELFSPPLRPQRSFFSVFSSADSRPTSRAESVRGESRGSVFERGSFMESNFFPAWARYVYDFCC